MRQRLLLTFSSLIVLMLLAIALPLQATASAAPAQQAFPATAAKPLPRSGTSKRGGVTISPAFQLVTINPEKTEVSFDFSVTNNSNREYEFALSVVDFGSLDETGGVLFVGNAEKALSYRYALSQWVTLGKDRVVVGPHATEKVPISIVNKESLTPGGHYGAVLVSPTESGSGADKKVQIDQVASSLLFVKKVGGEVYKLNLSSFKVRPHILSLPGSVAMRFQNGGNVHVIPHGLVTLTDPRGHVVKRGVINSDSGIVLPESFRGLNVPLQNVGNSWLPGRYKLTATYRYDDQTATRSFETSFVYLNLFFILAALAGLLLLTLPFASKKVRRWLKQFFSRLVRGISAILPKKD